MSPTDRSDLLELLVGTATPSAEEFKRLVMQLETYDILVKVFVLEGVPAVFGASPMKYVIFKEQVAERFGIGSQDVRIVGSARLGFSPSPHGEKYGKAFAIESDVDVVIVSERLFHHGSRELFRYVNTLGPAMNAAREAIERHDREELKVDPRVWRTVKEAVRNYVYQNFNPGLLPNDSELKQDIFEKISSTSGLFLALEPKVFVSKIRCRVFRDWRAAEDYYTNSLRELNKFFEGKGEVELEIDEDAPPAPEEPLPATPNAPDAGAGDVH